MQFFKHYTNMRHDIKIKRVIKRWGIEGYGLYNLIIESIAESLSSDRPIPELEETAQDIAEQYGGDTARINEMMAFMLNQGLFELNEITGRVLCKKLYKFIEKSQTRSQEIRNMIELYKMSGCPRQIETVLKKPDRIEVEVEVEVEKKQTRRFSPPSPDEVKEYLREIKNITVDHNSFCDYYQSKGWMIGKNKMKDWKAAVRQWVSRDKKQNGEKKIWPEFGK